MIYPISYLLDQFLNMISGFGFMGLSLALCGVIFTQCFLRSATTVEQRMLPPMRWIYIALGITAWTLLAAYNAPSCGLTFKGIFSILLVWVVFLLWPILNFSKIVYNPKISNFILIVSAIALVAQLFNWGLLSYFWRFNKPSGLFTEPSHVAMYLLPIIGYRLIKNNKDWLALGLTLFICVYFNSATFLVGLILIALVIGLRKFVHFQNKRKFLVYALGLSAITMLLILFGYFNISILTERIAAILLTIYRADPAGITNASAIVWLNGWSQAYDTLLVTRGLGLGLNQMGCGDFVNIGRFSDHISLWTGGIVLNANDGSFLISKLVAELGAIGLLIASYLLYKSYLATSRYVLAGGNKNTSTDPFLAINVIGGICMLLLMFIRSNGYFLEPVILDLSLLFLASRANEPKVEKAI
jgi:hypothetical protein